ncbi:MAG: LamG-like jellyroll fold domain-containing protein, partial [Victivallaceae bacterium]
MHKLKIRMLLAIAVSFFGAIIVSQAAEGKILERINAKEWTKGEKSIASENGTAVTYAARGQETPEVSDAGIALPSEKGAYLKVESKALAGDFPDGIGITVKFKLFPRDKSKTILRTLVSKYDYGVGDRCFSLMVDNHNRLEFSVSADGAKAESVFSKIKLEDEVEYTATAIFYPGKTLELYVNGSYAGGSATSLNKIYSGKSEIRIGSRSDKGNPAQLLNGVISQVDFFVPVPGGERKMNAVASKSAQAAPEPPLERIAIPFMDDKNWEVALRKAPELPGKFFKSEQELAAGKLSQVQAKIRVAYFSDNIGFLAHCPIPDMKKFNEEKKDAFVEICVDPNNGDQTLFAVKVQADGKVSNAFIASCDYVQKSWESLAQTKVQLNSDSYDVFVKIPYDSFGMKLSPGDMIGLAVGVNFKSNGKNELSVWPNRKVFWTWWQRRQIPDPFFFADILLTPKKEAGIMFVSTTRGALLANGVAAENSFSGEFVNTTAVEKKCAIAAFQTKDGQKDEVAKQVVKVAGGASMPVRFSYPAGGNLQIVATDENGTVLYDAALNRTLDIPQRIHDIGGGYAPEMVEKAKNPLAKDGWIIYPQHMKGNEWAHQNARNLGYAYDLESTMAAAGKNREIPHMTVRTETDYNNLTAKAGLMRKYGIKAAYYPRAHRLAMARPGGISAQPYMVNVSKNPKSKEVWDYKPLPGEELKRDCFAVLEQDISKFGDIIYALILEDEFDY